MTLNKLVYADWSFERQLFVQFGDAIYFCLAATICEEHKRYFFFSEMRECLAGSRNGIIAPKEHAIYARMD